MAKSVKVLLLENIPSLGQTGDIVTVSEGYARNALFPSAKAALATENVQESQEQKRREQQHAQQKQLKELQEKADKLDNTELTMEVRVKEGDELYGSITNKQLAKELNEQADLDVKAGDVELENPIKKLGTYTVTVRLSNDVDFALKLNILPDAESKAAMVQDDE